MGVPGDAFRSWRTCSVNPEALRDHREDVAITLLLCYETTLSDASYGARDSQGVVASNR